MKEVKTLMTISKGSIQGQNLDMTTKSSNKGYFAAEMGMGGMTLSKQVIGEKVAYQTAQGQKKNIEGDDLAEMKLQTMPFQELAMLADKNLKLEGIEAVNGKDCYVILYGKSKFFYDVTSGLRTAFQKKENKEDKKMTQTTSYEDYKEVKGIKFPYKTTLSIGVEIEFTTQDVKINEGVTDKDFE